MERGQITFGYYSFLAFYYSYVQKPLPLSIEREDFESGNWLSVRTRTVGIESFEPKSFFVESTIIHCAVPSLSLSLSLFLVKRSLNRQVEEFLVGLLVVKIESISSTIPLRPNHYHSPLPPIRIVPLLLGPLWSSWWCPIMGFGSSSEWSSGNCCRSLVVFLDGRLEEGT